jgi:antitoxin HigA-1
MISAHLRATDWRLYPVIVKANTAFGSMTNIESVSDGRTNRHMTSKSLTITRKRGKGIEPPPAITPGEILREEFMQPLELSSNALATALRVPANRIMAILKNQRGITADTALRLAQYFGNSPEFWMNLQQNYELDMARREKLRDIETHVLRRPPSHDPQINRTAGLLNRQNQ